MTTSTDEARKYVDSLTAELVTLAEKAGLHFLAYLLKMAQAEASGRADHVQRKSKEFRETA